jgi:hypothetical protein
VQVLRTRVEPAGEAYRANRDGMLALLAQLEDAQAQARAGGGDTTLRSV